MAKVVIFPVGKPGESQCEEVDAVIDVRPCFSRPLHPCTFSPDSLGHTRTSLPSTGITLNAAQVLKIDTNLRQHLLDAVRVCGHDLHYLQRMLPPGRLTIA